MLFHPPAYPAAARTSRASRIAPRQLLLEHFQADGIASSQSQILDLREQRLVRITVRQIAFGQHLLHRRANRVPQSRLKFLGRRHP
jgi:hypothetical protein